MLVSSMKSSLVIEPAPGTDFPKRGDRPLAVAPFGIFIFETKNWSTTLPRSPARETDAQGSERAGGRIAPPIDQNRSRLQFFRDQLPPIWPVQGAGIFTSAEAVPHPTLLADPLGAPTSRSLRIRRNTFAGANPIGIEFARTTVLLFADDSRTGLYKHKTAVASME